MLCVSPPAHHAAVDRTPDQTVQQQPGGLRGSAPLFLRVLGSLGWSRYRNVFSSVAVVFGSDG